ncbi:MAG: SRPBCC family protein [Chloroflexota bacterium]
MKFQNQILIHASTHEVFVFVADMCNIPCWNYFVSDVVQTKGDTPALGAQYHQVRQTDQQDYVITQYDEDRAVTVKTLPGYMPTFERQITFESTPDGTLIVDQWQISTRYPSFLERLAVGRIRNAVAQNLGKLKELLEDGQTRLQDGWVVRLSATPGQDKPDCSRSTG